MNSCLGVAAEGLEPSPLRKFIRAIIEQLHYHLVMHSLLPLLSFHFAPPFVKQPILTNQLKKNEMRF